MTSLSEPGFGERFTSSLEQIHRLQLKTLDHITDCTTDRVQTHRDLIKSAHDTCLKKCKEDEMLFDSIESFKTDLETKSRWLQDRRLVFSSLSSELQQKQLQKQQLLKQMEEVKEEQRRRREAVEAQNKSNKRRLKNLQEARHVFQEHLGLEIRAIAGGNQASTGEKLQFIFRNISRSDPRGAFIVTLSINADGVYQVLSSEPSLESLQFLVKKLQETNNLPAFLSNARSQFIRIAPH